MQFLSESLSNFFQEILASCALGAWKFGKFLAASLSNSFLKFEHFFLKKCKKIPSGSLNNFLTNYNEMFEQFNFYSLRNLSTWKCNFFQKLQQLFTKSLSSFSLKNCEISFRKYNQLKVWIITLEKFLRFLSENLSYFSQKIWATLSKKTKKIVTRSWSIFSLTVWATPCCKFQQLTPNRATFFRKFEHLPPGRLSN